jgi:negative regulator of flagellin synthesis FlgM
MSIERLGSIDPLSAYNRSQKTSRVQSSDKGDSINVSSEARIKGELFRLNEHVRNAPDIRLDRIEEVRQKMLDPNYINDTVLSTVADKVMESFGL